MQPPPSLPLLLIPLLLPSTLPTQLLLPLPPLSTLLPSLLLLPSLPLPAVVVAIAVNTKPVILFGNVFFYGLFAQIPSQK
jgi:hypothetical protein